MKSGKVPAGLIQAYQTAARRALLLDYDGTLVPFVEDPKQAWPDSELSEEPGAWESRAANGGEQVGGRSEEEWRDVRQREQGGRQGGAKTSWAGLLAGFTSEAVNWVI